MSECEYISVPAAAVEWLRTNYPKLCVKAGLCEQIAGTAYIRTKLQAPPLAAPAVAPAIVAEIEKLTQWKYCMSYNDSYFGEPEGLVKKVAYELERLLARPAMKAAPQGEGA